MAGKKEKKAKILQICFFYIIYMVFACVYYPLCVLMILQAEVNYLGQFSHGHLVKLIGYCLEDEHRLLVYEFMPRGSLENHLFRSMSHLSSFVLSQHSLILKAFCDVIFWVTGGLYFQPLSWKLRLKVALGAARGLAFLHSSETRVIYRDFKTSNILLDSVFFLTSLIFL